MSAAASIPNPAEQPQSTRRDFLVLSAAAFASVGAAAGLWPLVHSLNPSADTRAEATAEVNLARIEPGQAITVRWQGKPVFVVHRTEA
jgi:ubiquinol-cytochrome c reductase iron-sulfur subunit